MDVFSKVMFGGVSKAAAKFRPTKTEDIPPPISDRNPAYPVAKIDFVGAGLEVPGHDDDVPMRPWTARTLMKLNNLLSPFHDAPARWASVAACREALTATFGKLLPAPDVVWHEPASDAALERWAFQGFGAHRLVHGSAWPNASPQDQQNYVLPFEFMRRYAVRPGLARYGGNAWFSAAGKLLRIEADGRDIYPGNADWEFAKFALRTSTLVWTTLADHVGRCHYGVANAVVIATKRCLPRDHGLRGFLAPFHFRTAAINNGAAQSLVPKGALLHRTSGFTWDAMLQIYKDAPSEYRFETFPQELQRRGIDAAALGERYPYGHDGLAFWQIVERFVKDALTSSSALQEVLGKRRAETQAWWAELGRHLVGGLPELNEASLSAFLAHAIFMVTAFHAHVGTVTDFVTDPTFTAGKLWPGVTMADKQSTIHLCVVACITGFAMPGLMGDFRHLMPDEGARAALGRFQVQLRELEATLAARNAGRAQPFLTFVPSRIAVSVAI